MFCDLVQLRHLFRKYDEWIGVCVSVAEILANFVNFPTHEMHFACTYPHVFILFH